MASRDVNLIIRAKDEASRALNSVASELDALIGKQTGAAGSGKQLGGTIAELVSRLSQFEKVSGLVAQASDRAEAAIQRQRAGMAETAAQLQAVTTQLQNARKAIESSQSAIVNTKLSGGDTTALVAGLQGATAEVSRLEAEQRRLTASATAQQATLTEQERGFREIASMANSAEAAVKTFGDETQRANLKATAAVEATTAAYREQAAAAREAANADAANAKFSALAGVQSESPKSAAASAAVFQEQFAFDHQLQNLLDRTDPVAAIQRKLAEDIEFARQAMARGAITAEQFAKAETDLAHQAEVAADAIARSGKGSAGKPALFGLKPYELTNLGYQANDVITQFAAGTPVMQIVAQQGGQILQLMPKIGGLLTSTFRNPYFLAAAGVFIAIGAAVKRASDNAEQLRQIDGILSTMGENASVTSEELQGVVKSMERIGLSGQQALGLLRDFVSQGLNPAYLQAFARAAKDVADITGQDLKSSITEVEGSFTKGYAAVAALDDKMQFLTVAERAQIKAMFDSGEASAARTKAFQIFSERMTEIASKSRGEWSEAFRDLGNSVDRLLDRFSQWGVIQGFEHAIEQAARGMADSLTAIDDKTAEQVQREIARIEALRQVRERGGNKVDNFGDPFLMQSEEEELAQLKARTAEIQKQKSLTGDIVNQASAAAEKRHADAMQAVTDEQRLQQLRDKSTQHQKALTAAQGQERANLAGKLAYQQELNSSGDVELARAKQRIAVEHELSQVQQQNRAAVQRAQAERQREINQFENRVIGAEGGAAANPNSTAAGFGQFLNGTWLEQFRKVFASEAQHMSDQQILSLRNNQSVAKAIIDNYAQENARFLERFGKQVTAGNLYLTHFLGPAGALRILNANPNTPVDSLLSDAVMNANPQYLRMANGKGRARTAGELVDFIGNRVGDTGSAQSAGQTAIAELQRQSQENQDKFNLSVKQENDERQRNIDALTTENKLQDDKLIATQKSAAVTKAEFDLRKQVEDANKNLKPGQSPVTVTQEQIDLTKQLAAAEFDLQHARDLAEAQKNAVERPINDLTAERSALEQQVEVLRSLGDSSGADALIPKIQTINAGLVKAIDLLETFYKTRTPDQMTPLGMTPASINAALAGLEVLKAETLNWHDTAAFVAQDIQNAFAGSLTDSFKSFAQDLANGENVFKSLGRAALSFAASFLEKLADMGIQLLAFQAATKLGFKDLSNGLNGLFGVASGTGKAAGVVGDVAGQAASSAQMAAVATALTTAAGTQGAAATTLTTAATTLQAAATQLLANATTAASMAATGGGGGGILGSILGVAKSFIPGGGLSADAAATIAANPAIFHDGGIAGMGSSRHFVSPAWFQNAIRYHSGGIVGLKPDEVPTILQRDEEILTRNSPRHRFNGGGQIGGGRGGGGFSQILAIGDDQIAKALKSASGRKIVLTHIREERETVRQLLNG